MFSLGEGHCLIATAQTEAEGPTALALRRLGADTRTAWRTSHDPCCHAADRPLSRRARDQWPGVWEPVGSRARGRSARSPLLAPHNPGARPHVARR